MNFPADPHSGTQRRSIQIGRPNGQKREWPTDLEPSSYRSTILRPVARGGPGLVIVWSSPGAQPRARAARTAEHAQRSKATRVTMKRWGASDSAPFAPGAGFALGFAAISSLRHRSWNEPPADWLPGRESCVWCDTMSATERTDEGDLDGAFGVTSTPTEPPPYACLPVARSLDSLPLQSDAQRVQHRGRSEGSKDA